MQDAPRPLAATSLVLWCPYTAYKGQPQGTGGSQIRFYDLLARAIVPCPLTHAQAWSWAHSTCWENSLPHPNTVVLQMLPKILSIFIIGITTAPESFPFIYHLFGQQRAQMQGIQWLLHFTPVKRSTEAEITCPAENQLWD